MKIWLDNQLPPALAVWMNANLSVECVCVRGLNLQRASDIEIFLATGCGRRCHDQGCGLPLLTLTQN